MKNGRLQRTGGFTLIEVVCALAVMICLFGGVYGIANGALTLSKSSNEARTKELRLNNLDALFRTAFENMPSAAIFELGTSGEGGVALTCDEAPGQLCWNSEFAIADGFTLRTEADPATKGATRLMIGHWSKTALKQRRALGELAVLKGMESIQWRLYNSQSGQWERLWFAQQGRPLLAELTFRMKDRSTEQRMVFWIPAYPTQQQLSAPPVPPVPPPSR